MFLAPSRSTLLSTVSTGNIRRGGDTYVSALCIFRTIYRLHVDFDTRANLQRLILERRNADLWSFAGCTAARLHRLRTVLERGSMCPPLLSVSLRLISKSIRRGLLVMTSQMRACLPENIHPGNKHRILKYTAQQRMPSQG
jgi:hypothetical protein